MSREALYREIRERGGIADLSGRAKFHLTGADRVRYLNGQVSADIRQLGGTARPACLLTVKGKLVADLHVSATADFLRLDAAPERRDAVAARLERYIIADDVALADVTDDLALFHILGSDPGAGIPSRRLGIGGFDLFLPAAEREKTWTKLTADCPTIDAEMLELLRLEAGLPRWGAELDEDTLPAEAGLDLTAVDFHKGCYVGQEVVSRIKSVGRVNRQLRGFTAEAPLAPGETLLADGIEAGRITSAAWSFALARPIALGYVKRAATTDSFTTTGCAPVQLHDLPFTS